MSIKNILPVLLFLLIGLQFACTPKVGTVKHSPMPVSDKKEKNISVSEFEDFVYSIEKNGIYTETDLDKNPYPIDGKNAFYRKMYSGMNYPPIARENGVEGTVVIQFVVEKDGTIKDARTVRDIGAQCGAEALRVVNLMNTKGKKWTPGKQRGKSVRVQFNLPVKFRLE